MGGAGTSQARPAQAAVLSAAHTRRPREYAPFVALAAVFLYGAGCTLLVGSPERSVGVVQLGEATGFLLHALLGALLMWQRPENGLGALFALAGTALVLTVTLDGYAFFVEVAAPGAAPGGVWAWWVRDWLGVVAWAALASYSLLLLPDGRLPSPRWRPYGVTVGALAVVLGLAAALRPGRIDAGLPAANPVGWDEQAALLGAVDGSRGYVVAAAALVGVASVGLRWRQAWPGERRRLAWVAAALLVATVLLVVAELVREPGSDVWLVAASLAAVPVAVAVGALREDLVAIETWLVRGVIGGGAAVVAAGGWLAVHQLLSGALGPPAGHLAGGVVAVLLGAGFWVLRDRLEWMLRRWLFDQEPRLIRVLERIREVKRMDSAGMPLLRLLAREVRTAMDLPFVAIRRPSSSADVEAGRPTGGVETVALVVARQQVGTLEVGRRGRGEAFTDGELRLLARLADELAVVVRSARLRESLQVARAWLLREKELERQRVRRERAADAGDQDRGSHPEPLDRLDLRAAIEATAMPLRLAGVEVAMHVPADLPALPARLEDAAYQIAAAALDNVLRHADAGRCEVRVSLDAWALRLDVVDDGRGIQGPPGPGTAAAASCAEALGGSLAVLPGTPRGTRVHAELPRVVTREGNG